MSTGPQSVVSECFITYSRVPNNAPQLLPPPPNYIFFLNLRTPSPILFQPSIINSIISESLFQNFDSISRKTYAKFV